MTTWSLPQELGRAAGTPDLQESLHTLGILPRKERLKGWRCERDWYQSGAESYLYIFSVEAESGLLAKVVIKAYTPTIISSSIQDGLSELVYRRELLAGSGVRVPRLSFHGNGLVIEDFIEHGLQEWWRSSRKRDATRVSILEDLYRYATALDTLGFTAVSPFDDLRTDGLHAYVIDFGEDLGGRGAPRVDGHHVHALEEWLKKHPPVPSELSRERALRHSRTG